ncbi:MAG: O-linked N-acetylglucosamine transferase family protein [Planctomycetota bacterium]|jgi:predicted O-linked N-acetylglucosamine transferase (SPINDLY family)
MDSTASLLAAALRHHRSGELEAAERLYRQILDVDPDHFDALHLAGLVAYRRGRFGEAVELITRAVGVNPNNAEACYRLGNAVVRQGDLEQAIGWYERAVQLQPDYPEACYNLGTAMTQLDRTDEAIRWYERAIESKAAYPEACFNLGNAVSRQGRLQEAVEWYRKALQINPELTAVHNNLANMLMEQGELEGAINHYRQALELEPGYAEAHNNLGNVFVKQGRYAAASDCYEQALEHGSGSAETHKNLGVARANQGNRAAAIASFREALRLDPGYVAARSQLLLNQQHLCEWQDLGMHAEAVIAAVESGSVDVAPHAFVSVAGTTPAQQLQCARAWASKRFDRIIAAGRQVEFPHSRDKRKRLTVGYLSADFREHPMAMTIAQVIEEHDRSKVRALGYSLGRDDGSAIRKRLAAAFDEFVDLTAVDHLSAARKIHDDDVDILIDLMGYTRDSRLEIAALRPAPIQASYWGFCATTGAAFIDYMLVDGFVVPEAQSDSYSEQLIRLPGCYMPYDGSQEVSAETGSRADHGLPEDGLVFCCFNNSYKITPAVFDVWMRLLDKAEDSVLWLLFDRDEAVENLRKEAQSRGVENQRLVFAPRVPRPDHLARLRHADLFLDTIPYNAHTAANDALWAGCPVVTVAGETLASRVAGSALRTIGLPDLVTSSLDEYEQLALRLAQSPQELSDLRAQLVKARETSGLFDGAQKARDLEQAYARMWDIYSAGDPPRGFGNQGF